MLLCMLALQRLCLMAAGLLSSTPMGSGKKSALGYQGATCTKSKIPCKVEGPAGLPGFLPPRSIDPVPFPLFVQPDELEQSGSKPPHLSALVVGKGLLQLRTGVHHKGTVRRHRLADGLATEQQGFARAMGLQAQGRSCGAERR